MAEERADFHSGIEVRASSIAGAGLGVFATTLLPRSEHSTIVVTDYLLPPDVIADPALATGLDAPVEFMEIVIDQDTVVAERTQQGIGSRAFDRGVYPEKDAALHAFNERYRQLVAGAE